MSQPKPCTAVSIEMARAYGTIHILVALLTCLALRLHARVRAAFMLPLQTSEEALRRVFYEQQSGCDPHIKYMPGHGESIAMPLRSEFEAKIEPCLALVKTYDTVEGAESSAHSHDVAVESLFNTKHPSCSSQAMGLAEGHESFPRFGGECCGGSLLWPRLNACDEARADCGKEVGLCFEVVAALKVGKEKDEKVRKAEERQRRQTRSFMFISLLPRNLIAKFFPAPTKTRNE